MDAANQSQLQRFAEADRRRAQWLFADICLRDKEILIQTDHGRRAGWYVLLHEKYLCTLSYHSNADQFWDAYEVVDVIEGVDVAKDSFWDATNPLRYACRANPQFESLYAICRWDDRNQRVLARGLYIPFNVRPTDRLALTMRHLYREVRGQDEEE